MTKETDKTQLRLNRPGRLELKKTVEAGQIRQSFSHGRSKTVTVEVKRKRTFTPGNQAASDAKPKAAEATPAPAAAAATAATEVTAKAPSAPAAEAEVVAPAAEAPQAEPAAPVTAKAPDAAADPAPAEPASRPAASATPAAAPAGRQATGRQSGRQPARGGEAPRRGGRGKAASAAGDSLTAAERQTRVKALELAKKAAEQKRQEAEIEAKRRAAEDERRRVAEEEAKRLAEQEAERHRVEEVARKQLEAEEEAKQKARAAEAEAEAPAEAEEEKAESAKPAPAKEAAPAEEGVESELDELGGRIKRRKRDLPKPATTQRTAPRRRHGKLTISQALDGESEEERQRSLASVRRQREKLKQMMDQQQSSGPGRVVREVRVPETITVQDLANRMAERGGEVVKTLMKLGIMATINQVIDADTAELVVEEFGHKIRRVSAADVELGLKSDTPDEEGDLQPRPPVVTIMGHVDHGKTTLLDALRASDVASGEAGGITQHIGAYQVQLKSGAKITFIDTPGHAAFTAMRARGAKVTDLVVLVVAADDGIMDQTAEAINHARAAEVPIIVAINKMDKPSANPDRVRQELLQHELVVEEMGGDVLNVEVSATKKTGLDKLEEAILLQAELLELTANPDKPAEGIVVESKVEKGRGSVATVLVQSGTLRQGDVFIAGSEWGRVRALLDHHNKQVKEAGPATPVAVLGLQGTPTAGDQLLVVENESRAREVVDFRQQQLREKGLAQQSRGTLEQMLSRIREGEAKTLPVVIKADVHGSMEAIVGALESLGNDEVQAQILHAAVGPISESDVTLAQATGALIIGFNVRANPQARQQASQDNVDIRYYSIIYEVVDDIRTAMTGLLAPEAREKFLGYAEIRAIFEVSKAGKVAGCMITEGMVKRGAKVRLLRDDVVIHDGTLKTLRRFKDEVKEVNQGYECGMAFENYQDIKEGDRIECYEVEEVARSL
ncbi:MAG: translation initiation factor IF-2 [Pseudomonadota bacterium]